MHYQTSVFLDKFRIIFAGVFIVAFVLALSALVTAIGSNTALDTKIGSSADTLDTSAYDSSNAVTASIYKLTDGAKRMLVSTGRAIYSVCLSVTVATAQSGRLLARFGSVIARGIGSGPLFMVRLIGSGTMFVFHTPGRILRHVSSIHILSATIRPADDDTVPIINAGLSAATLTRATTQAQQAADQQKAADLQADQLVANRDLGGSAIAGDPNHGGYPVKWDAPTRQDSLMDSWGMYNRECVSYAAWKVYQTFGHMPYWGGVGNANQWPGDARAAGLQTGSTPQVHSVAISTHGYYGHAMWVEAVNGNMIYVSQYNYDLRGHYSEMWVGGDFTYIYFK